ncbi:MAG: fibronectin type III domain-containing protein [Actinobacteria bacterium]|nr:fibronectin type III domain-containing protein [Actinomycetota bacterium]
MHARLKFRFSGLAILAVSAGLFFAPPATALKNFREIPSTVWGHTYAGATGGNVTASRSDVAKVEGSTVFNVTYTNFPAWAKRDVQAAIDVWAANFPSTVPISVEATWVRQSGGILGSARPGSFFASFNGAPDSSLWYASALANALAGQDLDPDNPEIVIQANALANWDQRNDGRPTTSEYDLMSVFIHEIAHGLGFLSTNSYDTYFKYGILDQPTIFDAYLQTADGHRVSDSPSPSLELGQSLTSSLVWAGPLGILANNGVAPKMYTPAPYESGSSVSHLDEDTFSSAGLDSVMTPNLDAGEVFHQPGPLLLAMLADLRNKPPVGIVTDVPLPPQNALALIGDSSAIVTFDPPTNVRLAQVLDYTITNNKTQQSITSNTSPVVMSGLQNGTPYNFSVTARNVIGTSQAVSTNTITPTNTWIPTYLDKGADGKHIATATFRGMPAVVYTDSPSGDVKLALWTGRTWNRVLIDGRGGTAGRTADDVSGPVSVCVSGAGAKQIMHIFYTDVTTRDIHYASYDTKKFLYAVVDGDGPIVQPYDQTARVRTASDVSVSNACASTAAGIQVFYRDESQGILLGAHKAPGANWVYELIDGDRKTNNRTTGDVAMKLRAVAVGSKVTIIYSSIINMNSQKVATNGEVRLATRIGTTPLWNYQTLDKATSTVAVAGYDVALSKTANGVIASWMTSSRLSLAHPNQIRWVNTDAPSLLHTLTTGAFGSPSSPMSIDATSLLFGCQERICATKLDADPTKQSIKLVSNSRMVPDMDVLWITIKKIRYALASVDGKLTLLKP